MLKNYDEVINELVDLMIQFDAEMSQYQTDVYLYIDEDGIGSLDTYINVGGNSWLNDDHITVYKDLPHYEGTPDGAEDMSVEELADELRTLYLSEYRDNAEMHLDEALRNH